MNNKPTVTIGISAHNEETNIKNLLNSILSQGRENFELGKIIVMCDGGDDFTEQQVREIGSEKIMLVADGKRLGKPMRINQIFSEADSDIAVIFDADIKLEDDNVLDNLIKPFLSDSEIMLVSGKSEPLPPVNFVQKVVYTGVKIWNEAKKHSGSMMYFCEGPIRAFKKPLYKEIKFPPTSADDVYPYLFSVQRGYKFHYAENALVRHKLPSTYADYIKQTRRYLKSENIHKKNFGAGFIKNHYAVSFSLKAKVFLKHLFINPFWTLVYLTFIARPKIAFLVSGRCGREGSSLWEIVKSTK